MQGRLQRGRRVTDIALRHPVFVKPDAAHAKTATSIRRNPHRQDHRRRYAGGSSRIAAWTFSLWASRCPTTAPACPRLLVAGSTRRRSLLEAAEQTTHEDALPLGETGHSW